MINKSIHDMATEETKRSPLTRRKIWIFILLICYIFILSGGANTGFSKFFMALPFMLVALLVSKVVLKNTIYKNVTFFLILFSVIFNITLTKNPMAFPILYGGYIEIISDGFHITFSDGSGGFYDRELKDNDIYDNATYKRLKNKWKNKWGQMKLSA